MRLCKSRDSSENTTVTTTTTTVVLETTTANDTVVPPIVMVDDDNESSEDEPEEEETIETTEATLEETTEAQEEPQGFLARTKVSFLKSQFQFIIHLGQNCCCCSIRIFHLITPVKYFCSKRIKEAKII